MNIAKQYDPKLTETYYNHYQKMLNGKIKLPTFTRAIKVNDCIRLILPLTTGNGRWITFYGLCHVSARVTYVDSGHILYSVNNARYECIDEFLDKFSTFRLIGESYWYDFRNNYVLMYKE